MTGHIVRWWRVQPPLVAAALTWASLRDGELDIAFDQACDLLAERADDLRELSVLLRRIDALDCGSALPSEIAAWMDVTGTLANPSAAAEYLSGVYRDRALGLARRVAGIDAQDAA